MKKVVNLCLVLTILLLSLTGCTTEKNISIQEKNISELEYIETNLVKILNNIVREEYAINTENENKEGSLNVIEAELDTDKTEENLLDWEKLLKDTKKIEKALATTLVDLAALNIETSEIAKLNDGVDNMIIAIENKDENQYLIELNNVYALIPMYMEKYAQNNEIIFKKKLKYYTLSTYVAYREGDLEVAKKQVSELERIYDEKMQDLDYAQSNEYNLNKLYVLIQELKRAIDTESNELVKSKYLLTIEEI